MLDVRELRFKHRVTQQELAQASGLNQTTISYIETHPGYDIKVSTLIALCNYFGLSSDEFLEYRRYRQR